MSIVIQKTRQLRMQKTDIRLVRRWAVRSFDSSALQPDLRILWKTSIFHLKAYHSSFSIASAREPTGRSLISFHSIFFSSASRALRHGDHRQGPRGIALLLSDRRQGANLAISDLEDDFIGIAVVVSDVDAMESFDRDLVHFVGDRMITIPSQAVKASPDHEMRSSFSSRAEQLIDVALAITDMDASFRIAQQLCGLPDIVQPPNALLLLDGNARRIDLLLKRGSPFEFLPSLEFDSRQSKRQPFGRHIANLT
ncbi:hypothetical protein ABIC03_007843 [Bradyrhizobium sp. RT6a]|uniref:hypothetical protein n=1 Tax=Bradyrhizobium sp. RT6a TaxID=3156381 RepID=UPI003391AD68